MDKELEIMCARNAERRRWAEEAEAADRARRKAVQRNERDVWSEVLLRSAQRCAWALVGAAATLSVVSAIIGEPRGIIGGLIVGLTSMGAALIVEGWQR